MTDAPAALDQAAVSARAAANALTDERRFQEAYDVLRRLVEDSGQEDRVGLLGNVCRETGRLDEAEFYYRRYRDFAEAKGVDLQFDAAVQSGRLASALGEPSRALTFFLQARRLLAQCRSPSVSPGDLEVIVARALRELTSALTIEK